MDTAKVVTVYNFSQFEIGSDTPVVSGFKAQRGHRKGLPGPGARRHGRSGSGVRARPRRALSPHRHRLGLAELIQRGALAHRPSNLLGGRTPVAVPCCGVAAVSLTLPGPAMPDARAAECLEVIGPARPPRQSLRLVSRRPQRRRTSETGRSSPLQPPRQASWHIGRDAASPEPWAARAPVVPPRSPQLRPRQL